MSMDQVLAAKPFIICEVGSNWKNIDDCFHSIIEAKKCGADAVKFQMFDHDSLFGFRPNFEIPVEGFWGGVRKKKVPMAPLHGGIPMSWIETLALFCRAQNIEFMCTAFSVEALRAIDPFVKYHKVASSDLDFKELFDELRELRKPVFFSTGGHGIIDVKRALNLLKPIPSVVMYCVSAYPAKSVDLRNITYLKNELSVEVGFSDHTTQIYEVPKRAVELGAVVIEKHFKIREMDTPDNPHSLTPSEFRTMVDNILDKSMPVLGDKNAEESDMIGRHNRRLIAIRDIAKGERLELFENYGPFRSLKPKGGVSGWLAHHFNHKIATRDIVQGDVIELDSFK